MRRWSSSPRRSATSVPLRSRGRDALGVRRRLAAADANRPRTGRASSSIRPEEMTVRVRAGTTVERAAHRARRAGQRTAAASSAAAPSAARSRSARTTLCVLGRGTVRAAVLQVRYVSAEGRIVNGGGPTVKNVTGFDLPRLMVGALGTSGLLAEVILRTNPIRRRVSMWLASSGCRPVRRVRLALQRPVPCSGTARRTWFSSKATPPTSKPSARVLARLGSMGRDDRSPNFRLCAGRSRPAELRSVDSRCARHGSFVASIGVGRVRVEPNPARQLSSPVARSRRADEADFDPTGRLNPGRDPGMTDEAVMDLMDLGIDATN